MCGRESEEWKMPRQVKAALSAAERMVPMAAVLEPMKLEEQLAASVEGKKNWENEPTPGLDVADPRHKPLSPEFQAIVKTTFEAHPHALYKQLELKLTVGEGRAEHASVAKALDEAETCWRQAYRLYLSARLEVERWELDNAPVLASMRGRATRELQREKDEGHRSKAITDADVEAKMAALWPDEYKAATERGLRAKLMLKSMEHLAEAWGSRCRSLQTIHSKQR
jgi:hypothetical protein